MISEFRVLNVEEGQIMISEFRVWNVEEGRIMISEFGSSSVRSADESLIP